jgi:hypothetical protein
MPICCQERRISLKGGKTQTEVIGKAMEDSAGAEHAKLMGKFAMNRIDVITEVYSCEAAESCAA